MISSSANTACPGLPTGLGNDEQPTASGSANNADFELYGVEPFGFSFDFNVIQPPQAQTQTPTLPSSQPQPSLQGAYPTASRVGSRVTLACIPCRTRHLRCDAAPPICSRCRLENKPCSYAKSRRGRGAGGGGAVPSRKRAARRGAGEKAESRRTSSSGVSSASPSANHADSRPASAAGSESYRSISQNSDARCEGSSLKMLELYYKFFHNAHPFTLPRQYLIRRLHTDNDSLQHLIPVMKYIGSLIAPTTAPSESFRLLARDILPARSLPLNGFSVQSLLLLAIVEHCTNKFDEARYILNEAILLALKLDMQSQSFAIVHGEGCSALEESWRRTWWTLYVTDGIFAGIRHCLTFSLWGVKTDVDLPCEEDSYCCGSIPPPRTLYDYDNREFAEEDIVFSSFTYLIDLGRILGTVLEVGTEAGVPFDPGVIKADSNLVNWALYLPKSKKSVIRESGSPDEILFQAHMLFNTLKVYLHRPRSRLAYSPMECVSECAPPPPEQPEDDRQRSYDFHTTKILGAANAAIDLFALPSPVVMHTPLVICGLTLAILAQISACTFVLKDADYVAGRDRVRLGLGAVKEFGEVWPVGRKSMKEVKVIAREVLSLQSLVETRNSTHGLASDRATDTQTQFGDVFCTEYLGIAEI